MMLRRRLPSTWRHCSREAAAATWHSAAGACTSQSAAQDPATASALPIDDMCVTCIQCQCMHENLWIILFWYRAGQQLLLQMLEEQIEGTRAASERSRDRLQVGGKMWAPHCE